MHCPFCRHPDSRVVDSRETDEGQAIQVARCGSHSAGQRGVSGRYSIAVPFDTS